MIFVRHTRPEVGTATSLRQVRRGTVGVRPSRSTAAVLLICACALGTQRTPATAAVAAKLVAVINNPAPGAKLRDGQTVSVHISVRGPSSTPVTWTVLLAHGADLPKPLASGSGLLEDQEVARVSADDLVHGEQYQVTLAVTDGSGGSTDADVPFLVPDPLYELIPMESGNYSLTAPSTSVVDGNGNLVGIAGPLSEPQEFILVTRSTGQHQSVFVELGSNSGVWLTADGTRLYYKGDFPSPSASLLGLGYFDLVNASTHLATDSQRFWYTVSGNGHQMAYQGDGPAGRGYFLWNEDTQETRQLTDAPDAIVQPDGCTGSQGTRPLISRDGREVVLITSSTLGVVPADSTIGCRIYAYNAETDTLRKVATFPSSAHLSLPWLSADGRWLSVVHGGPSADGSDKNYPALLDVGTGALRDPVVELNGHSSYDSVITGDGNGIVISNQGDLDPRVGNADHNFELFHYDLQTGEFHQITETVAGLDGSINSCDPYDPRVSDHGDVVVLGFYRISGIEGCVFNAPQQVERNGLSFKFTRAVRKRPGNHGPVLAPVPDQRVVAGETLSVSFTAQDPDGDPITFFAQEQGGIDVPRGSQIVDNHDGTGSFRWPTVPDSVGNYVLRVAAFDEGGGETVQDVAIAVVPHVGTDTPTPSATAPLASPTPTAFTCPGDCNHDGQVTVAELITGTTIALGSASLAACPTFDCRGTGTVTIDCLTQAVAAALSGCH